MCFTARPQVFRMLGCPGSLHCCSDCDTLFVCSFVSALYMHSLRCVRCTAVPTCSVVSGNNFVAVWRRGRARVGVQTQYLGGVNPPVSMVSTLECRVMSSCRTPFRDLEACSATCKVLEPEGILRVCLRVCIVLRQKYQTHMAFM